MAINYLSFVVRNGKHDNAAVVNYLLSLLAEQVRLLYLWIPSRVVSP